MYRLGSPLLSICTLILLIRIFSGVGIGDLITAIDSASLQSFKILFISIILEAFPFILLGVLLSAILQVFVSDALIAKLTPKNPVAGVLFGSLLGLLFPLCECGMIPVVRRLIRKGMPAYIGIVFIFAGPIINPVVYASTYTAFRAQPAMAYSRIGIAFVVCVALGLFIYRFMPSNPLKHAAHSLAGVVHNHGDNSTSNNWRARIGSVFAHASDEFFDTGKYLIFGALLTAVAQTSVDRSLLVSLSNDAITANLFMMGFAFLLSLCSTSDAFVASSFNGIFGPGALLAFLVFGPMVDLKSTLMLLATFRTKAILIILAVLFILVFAGSIIAEKLVFP